MPVNDCEISNCRCSILLTKISARLAQQESTRPYITSIKALSFHLFSIALKMRSFLDGRPLDRVAALITENGSTNRREDRNLSLTEICFCRKQLTNKSAKEESPDVRNFNRRALTARVIPTSRLSFSQLTCSNADPDHQT
jgi:hypothetical protein